MTQTAKPVSITSTDSSGVDGVISQFYLPQIIFCGSQEDTIEIIRKEKKKKHIYYSRVKVDRSTGIIVESNKNFSHVSKFDPKTFPEQKEVLLDDVAYWDQLNRYKSCM